MTTTIVVLDPPDPGCVVGSADVRVRSEEPLANRMERLIIPAHPRWRTSAEGLTVFLI